MITRPRLFLRLVPTRFVGCTCAKSANVSRNASNLAAGRSFERDFTKSPVFSKKPKSSRESSSFVDFCYVRCISGHGGDGKISFLREYAMEFGGPDGGNGGNGGHVIFQADSQTTDLSQVKATVKAERGDVGEGKCCHGRDGEHAIVKVPLNTLIKAPSENHRNLNEGIIHELSTDGEVFIAARGGAGGHGNYYYLANDMRKPVMAESGGESETVVYELEMRRMAVAGLVGFPNAGKSSFLQAISRAKPKVASYPFTTLKAHIGMVMYDDFKQLAVADIPGLIEGAHKNEGLGFSFLRHICRCEFIFYVLDYTLGEWRTQLEALVCELDLYSRELCSSKAAAVLINKCDLIKDETEKDTIKSLFPEYDVFFVSAREQIGIEPVLKYLRGKHDDFEEAKKEQREMDTVE